MVRQRRVVWVTRGSTSVSAGVTPTGSSARPVYPSSTSSPFSTGASVNVSKFSFYTDNYLSEMAMFV